MNTNVKLLLVTTGGFALGFGAGYLFTKKRFEKIAAREVEDVKNVFQREKDQIEEDMANAHPNNFVHRPGEGLYYKHIPTEDEIAEIKTVQDELVNLGYSGEVDVTTVEHQTIVLETDEEDSAYKPLPLRDPEVAYLITSMEFEQGHDELEQQSLVYFSNDDVLIDDRKETIENIDQTVNRENLERFGQGSGDKNVVFVRNERLGIDFEIVQDFRSYLQVVHGVEPEPENDPRVRRFRDTD